MYQKTKFCLVAAQHTCTAKLPAFLKKTWNTVCTLRVNETKITFEIVFIVDLFELEDGKRVTIC